MPSCFHGLDKESVKVRICAGLLFFVEETRSEDSVFVLNLVMCVCQEKLSK